MKTKTTSKQPKGRALLILLLFVFYSVNNFAQISQLKLWSLPDNQVKFTPAPVVSPIPSGGSTYGYNNFTSLYGDLSHNAMHDINGNLLFFIAKNSVYDQDGDLIGHLDVAATDPSIPVYTSPEISIIPDLNSCTKFYIVTGWKDDPLFTNDYRAHYAIIEMSAQNPNFPSATTYPTKKGALQLNGTGGTLFPFPNTGGAFDVHSTQLHLAVSKVRTVGPPERFIFIADALFIYRFILDGTGISYDVSSTPINTTSNGSSFLTGEMELYEDLPNNKYKLATVARNQPTGTPSTNSAFKIFNATIDYTTGNLISNFDIILPNPSSPSAPHPIPCGIEFSPNGNFLYFTHATSSTLSGNVRYYNFTTGTLTMLGIPSPTLFQGSQIELGYGQIVGMTPVYPLYFPSVNGLTALNDANNPASGFTSYSFSNSSLHLPDQIDGENYISNSAILTYTAGTPGASTYTTYGSAAQTWTPTNNPFGGTATNPVATVSILDKLIIPPGFNITISGMTFLFRPRTLATSGTGTYNYGARVLVQNSLGAPAGGRLSLINSTFTNSSCGTGMWEGVEVWGENYTTPQGTFATGKQGWFKMNNSTISNAYIGALAGKKYFDPTTTYVYNTPSYGGGVIQTTSYSEFLNNQYGVYFSVYNIGNNQSYFTNAKFTTNALFISVDAAKPNTMAFMNDVKGIYYRACTFYNDPLKYPQITTPALYGIRGYHAQFFCIPVFYGSSVGCTFDNFKYGVYATYYNNTKTVTIDYAKFTNNYRGTYLSGAQLVPTIVRNKYNIMNYAAGSAINRAYGLYLNACNGYKVEGNDFTTVGSSTTADDIGIIVNNSGPNPNLVYRNTFHEVFGGAQAQNTNCNITTTPGVAPNDFGLQFLCNQFTTIKNMDMGITSGCTDYHQGFSGSPAGNKFSHSFNTPYNDYYNYSSLSGARIDYVHNNDYNYTPQFGFYTPYPAIALTAAPAATPDYYDASTDCLSSLSGFHLTPLPGDIKTQINNYQNQLIVLKALLNAGSDPSLITAINSSMSEGTLKNLLLSKSPYLSDEVLIAALTRMMPLSNGHIKEIIVANSPVTQQVLDALNGISLPNGIRNQINAAQVGISERSKTEDKIKYYQFQISITKNDIVRAYVNDTTVDVKTDTIISRVKEYEGIDAIGNTKEKLADLYVEKQDYTMAETMLTAIETDPAKQNFVKIKRVNKNLKQSGQTTADLQTNIVEKQKVDEVAADDLSQGYELAINMLQEIFNEPYVEPIEEISPSLHSYTPMPTTTIEEAIIQPALYPNPNNGSMQLDYSLSEGETGQLKIMDITGRLVAEYNLNASENVLKIDQTILNPGMYLYQILTNGEIVFADKLIIAK